MHPALSVIVFTTASGIGYGLLAWVGLLAPIGALPLERRFGAVSLALAIGFITAGLLSSTIHLGHPERAWRAFSQWRSSWLSREGLAALATYVPALAFAVLWLLEATGIVWAACGMLAAAGSIVTVICTAMIYRSLKPIRQWDNHWVVPNYLLLAAMTGALWLAAVLDWLGERRTAVTAIAAALVLAAAAVKIFLLREMGYRIARRHAAKLRRIAMVVGFGFPFVAIALAGLLRGGAASAMLALAAAVAATAGVLVERWLFFAEATHTVALYYGGGASSSARSPR